MLRHVEERYQQHEPDESSEFYESMVHLITAPDLESEEPNGVRAHGLGDQFHNAVSAHCRSSVADAEGQTQGDSLLNDCQTGTRGDSVDLGPEVAWPWA